MFSFLVKLMRKEPNFLHEWIEIFESFSQVISRAFFRISALFLKRFFFSSRNFNPKKCWCHSPVNHTAVFCKDKKKQTAENERSLSVTQDLGVTLTHVNALCCSNVSSWLQKNDITSLWRCCQAYNCWELISIRAANGFSSLALLHLRLRCVLENEVNDQATTRCLYTFISN